LGLSLQDHATSSAGLSDWLRAVGAVNQDNELKSYQLAYRTTNEVYLGSNCVLKRYVSQEGFNAEIQALEVCAKSGIKAPQVLAYTRSETFGTWAKLQRLPGIELSLSRLNGHEVREIGEKIVIDLIAFEFATKNDSIANSQVWSFETSLHPFLESLQMWHYLELSQYLELATKAADIAFSGTNLVNCMDIYFGNVLVDRRDGFPANVNHIDFDKSWRLVPEGEQLSHFAQFNIFSQHLNYLTDLYCVEKKLNPKDLRAVFGVFAFFRALSGMRDSFSALQYSSQSSERRVHADLRLSVFRKGLETALNQMPKALGFLGLPDAITSLIRRDFERLRLELDKE
jgi:hypothetical protein